MSSACFIRTKYMKVFLSFWLTVVDRSILQYVLLNFYVKSVLTSFVPPPVSLLTFSNACFAMSLVIRECFFIIDLWTLLITFLQVYISNTFNNLPSLFCRISMSASYNATASFREPVVQNYHASRLRSWYIWNYLLLHINLFL